MRLIILTSALLLFCCSARSALENNNGENVDSIHVDQKKMAKEALSQEHTIEQPIVDDTKSKISFNQILEFQDKDSIFGEFKKIDLGHLFVTHDYSMDGAIGDTFKRLKINITDAIKSAEDSTIYKVIGKTKVNSNICDFAGQIKITSTSKYEDQTDNEGEPPYEVLGAISGDFEFYEDKSQTASGVFKGSFHINWNINDQAEIVIGSAWYTYRGNMVDYSGTWTGYKMDKSKKVCWGDAVPSCLPDDFNCSDGPDFIPCQKYANNGWETLRAVFDYSNNNKQKESVRIETEKWWR